MKQTKKEQKTTYMHIYIIHTYMYIYNESVAILSISNGIVFNISNSISISTSIRISIIYAYQYLMY